MKTISSLFILAALLFTPPTLADGLIVPGTSNEFHNTQKVHEFLLDSNQLEMAAYLATVLEKGRLYWMNRKDFWGDDRDEEGFTYLSGKVYIREDVVQRTSRLDPLSSSDFAELTEYINVAIHEMYHLLDFQTTPDSSENETYYRSFLVFRDILKNHLLKNYELHDSLGSPEKKLWLDRVRIYAQKLHGELMTYETSKYGETSVIPRIFDHDGCVRPALTRTEFAAYALMLGTSFNDSQDYAGNYAKFDRWARYMFPVYGNQRCMTYDNTIAPMPPTLPVGYKGPRLRQRIFEIDAIEADNYLRIVKTNSETQNADIDIFVDREDPSEDASVLPKSLLRVGNLWQWHKEGQVYFKDSLQRFLVVIAERSESGLPTNLALTFTRRWKDDQGNWREGFIGSKEITNQEQVRYGFYPISEKITFAQFDKRSPVSPDNFRAQVYGLKFQALKGDHLRLSGPQTDGRRVLVIKADPKPEQVAVLWDWYSSLDYLFTADGTYFLIVERHNNLETNHAFQLSLQSCRNGRSNPQNISFTPFASDDYKKLGMHAPAEKTISLTIDPATSPLGLGVSWGTFRPFAIVELNTAKGDWLEFTSLPTYLRPATSFIAKLSTSGQLELVQNFFSWYPKGDYRVQTDDRYFFVVVRNEEFGEVESSTVEVKHYRGGTEGPNAIQYRHVPTSEVATFGYFPMGRFQFDKEGLTPLHPRGFIFPKARYQHYVFAINKQTRLRLNKGEGSFSEYRFVVAKVDEALWAANQPALQDVLRTQTWHRTSAGDLEPGRYVLTLEAELPLDQSGKEITNLVPWDAAFTSIGTDPRAINLRKLTVDQMADPRLRLKSGN